MATNYVLKPFVINLDDLDFLLQQVSFRPLFDAQGNGVVDWNGSDPVWNAGNQPIDLSGFATAADAIAALGTGFPSTVAPIGIRDVTGEHNNLFGVKADWGAVDVAFRRDVAADFSGYLTSPGANYATTVDGGGIVMQSNVVDVTPRMISRTITTGGVNLLRDANNHFVAWDHVLYEAATPEGLTYKAMIDSAGVNTSTNPDGSYITLVDGAKIVAPAGASLTWDPAIYSNSTFYKAALTGQAAFMGDGHIYSSTGAVPVNGETIYFYNGATYVPFTIGGVQINFDAALYTYRSLIDSTGVNVSTLATGTVISIDLADPDLAGGIGDVPATGLADLVIQDSGYGLLQTLGHIDFQNPTSGEHFIGSENPGVAPVNSWFAIFGQFFDHGLDLIGKGGQGTTIKISLAADDPLNGVPGPDGQPVTAITINRATVSGVDANGDSAYINHTSPFIDQSQTYGSSAQITLLLREWISTDGNATFQAGYEMFDGYTLAKTWTRKLVDGTVEDTTRTLPTLGELRDHVLDTNRSALTWEDVSDYRNRDANGQIDMGAGAGNSGHALILDMNPRFDSAHLDATTAVGNSTVDALIDAAVATLAADAALLGMTFQRSLSGGIELLGAGPQPLTGAGALALWINFADFSIKNTTSAGVHAAVGEILMAAVGDHYIAGDGRVNENFGLTAIHHVFHEEHNYQVVNLMQSIFDRDDASGDAAHTIRHEWQVDTGATDGSGNFVYADGMTIAWNLDKVFEATKLIVEMEYQHAAVDQYARTVTPRIQEFVGYSSGIDPTVSLEYSQVAFRFGHSTIRESIDTIDPTGWFKGEVTRYALEQAFLNPAIFASEGPADVTLGLSRQQMNEVDEFITPALTQGLLGQPLDLAAINIARGRDLGIPTLNDFRDAIGLARYASWSDYGANMIHPESLVNFLAAYGFNGDTAMATAVVGLVDGSIVEGDAAALGLTSAEALAVMSNDTTALLGNAALMAAADGFDHIDTWIGGLAESHVPGGLLGETFDTIFVAQIESLMDGDRFYYLFRLAGTQIHEEVNNGQFKDIVERNTGLEHLNGSIFAYADQYYDLTRGDSNVTATSHQTEHAYGDILATYPTLGIWTDGGASMATNGTVISVNGSEYIRDVRPEPGPTQIHTVEGTPTSGADSHEVLIATDNADYIHMRGGDDTAYGEGGDDIIFGDGGVDRLYGGEGDDWIDTGEGPDLADGGAGDDTIYGRGSGSEVGGFDQLVGGSGNDTIYGGEGIDKLSGGSGDDVIYGDDPNIGGGNTDPFTHGGDGNDYIDGGISGDNLYGDAGDDLVVGGDDQDLIIGGTGDDILRPGNPSAAINGGPDEVVGGDGLVDTGFDLMDFSDYVLAATGVVADMATQANPLVAIDGTTPFPAWFQMEGVIGSQNTDRLIGDDVVIGGDEGDQVGNNWLIGGSGDDALRGNGGNDVIIGDSVRLDSLIGSYDGTYTAYDVLAGASHRTTGTLQQNGLLGNAALGTTGFDLHFTEMLRSERFQNLTLGDNLGAGADTAEFSGDRIDYTIERIAFFDAQGVEIVAYKITDNGGLLADGTVRTTNDGTDIVVGVERFQFADGTLIGEAQLLNVPPSIDGGATAAFALNEGVQGVAQLTATDGDNLPLQWSIVGGADAALFQINPATGQLSFIGTPNFELPTDAGSDNVYDVVVAVSDSLGASDSQSLSVTIGNVDEVATGALHIASYTATNASATLNAVSTVTDGDLVSLTNATGAVTGFQWQRLGNNGTWQNIAGATGTALAGQVNTTVRVTQSYTDAFGLHLVVSDETAFVTGSNGNNILAGTVGADIMLGLGGSDRLTGLAGNDILDGGNGSDRFLATVNDGDDIYRGGTGTDIYDLSGTNAGATIQIGTPGVYSSTSAQTGTDQLFSVENFVGSQGDDTVVVNGGSNTIDGQGGADTIRAGGSNDIVLGGAGNDRLFGEAGSDRLTGEAGGDELEGGTGSDVFVYAQASDSRLGIGTLDVIFDFAAGGTDDIDLGAFNFGGTRNDAILERNVASFATGNIFDYFDANPGPGTTDRAVVVEYITGTADTRARVYVDTNQNGNLDLTGGTPDMVIEVRNIVDGAFRTDDFIF